MERRSFDATQEDRKCTRQAPAYHVALPRRSIADRTRAIAYGVSAAKPAARAIRASTPKGTGSSYSTSSTRRPASSTRFGSTTATTARSKSSAIHSSQADESTHASWSAAGCHCWTAAGPSHVPAGATSAQGHVAACPSAAAIHATPCAPGSGSFARAIPTSTWSTSRSTSSWTGTIADGQRVVFSSSFGCTPHQSCTQIS